MSRFYETLLAIAAAAAEHGSLPTERFNPRPLGSIVAGSGTELVHRALLEVAPYSLPFAEIRKRTGLGRGCIAWALRHLEHIEKIEVVGVTNDRGPGLYQRYRAKP